MSIRSWRFRNDHLEVGGFATRADLRGGYEDGGGVWDDASFFWWKVFNTLRWGARVGRDRVRAHLDGSFQLDRDGRQRPAASANSSTTC